MDSSKFQVFGISNSYFNNVIAVGIIVGKDIEYHSVVVDAVESRKYS